MLHRKHQLTDFLCRFSGRGRKNMAVNIQCSGNVFMSKALLCDLYVNALQ